MTLVGYFGSGSGVASQEQYHSAYGLAKAFWEMNLSIPAVIRLGGNSEDRAVQILTEYCKDLPAPVEGYKKDDTPKFCAERFKKLSAQHRAGPYKVRPLPEYEPPPDAYNFKTITGHVYIDHRACDKCESKVCVEQCVPQILSLADGRPVLNISYEEAAAGKCIECLACEVECAARGNGGGYVHCRNRLRYRRCQ